MKVIECDEDEEGNAIRAELGKRTGRTSMPSIWVRGEGYAQTLETQTLNPDVGSGTGRGYAKE
jgi:hypothetical protein